MHAITEAAWAQAVNRQRTAQQQLDLETNQHHAKCRLTLALAFPVVNVQLTEAALSAVGSGHDADVSLAATS